MGWPSDVYKRQSEAKAEAIQTRQVEVLESQRYVDPIRYMTFMERIKKTLSDYMQAVSYTHLRSCP